VAYHRLLGFFGFEIERLIGQVIGAEVGLTDWKSAMPLVMTLVLFLVLQNLKFSLTTLCTCFGKRIRLVVDVRIIKGGLPVLTGTAFSFEVASVPEESVSVPLP
jgi:hypothetical protein